MNREAIIHELMNREVIIHELMNKVSELEKFFQKHNPVDTFSEEIRPCQNSDGKILNVNIGFSFQSHKDDEKPELCISSFYIGHNVNYIKHKDKEWKEEHYGKEGLNDIHNSDS